ncbi:prepilin peptidase [Nocardioides caldifontis]|uniref:prepilin peptidase n=1 Tax=Nocardioides caldifontis TaxID=2588938 RepID=UPI0011DFC28C|nr:A24 family peptidase [Nocardioides caldifontis]
MTWYLDTAAVMAGVGFLTGLGVPTLIGRIPEPASPEDEVDEADASTPEDLSEPVESVVPPDTVAEEPKELYTSIAALPGLAWKAGVAAAVVGGLLGAVVGWQWDLLVLMYLVPVGVALAVVDWRTRLLPTKVIAPSYLVVIALALVAGALGDWDDLARAGWGWAVAGGTFLLMWLIYPRGMGYGDVRLSGLLGIALGFSGWGALLVGVYAGFLLGGLGGALLSALRIVDRKAYPFGPFMLLGAVVGVLTGEWAADWYSGRS